MSRIHRKRAAESIQPSIRFQVLLTAILFFAVEVIVIPGAFSPFRQPKMDIAALGLFILVGCGLAIDLWRTKVSLPAGRLSAVLVALPAIQALSTLWSATPTLALKNAGLSALWILAALRIATWSTEERKTVLRWTVGGAVVSSLVLFLQLTGSAPFTLFSGHELGDRLSLTGLSGNPSDLGMAGVLLIPLLLLPFLGNRRRHRHWILPLFFMITALFTEGLTSIATVMLLGAGVLLLFRSRKAFVTAGILTVVVVGTVFGYAPLRSRMKNQVDVLRRGDWYTLLSARFDGWSAATTMVENSPVVGVGAGQFSREFYSARQSWLEETGSSGRRGEFPTHFDWAHNDLLHLVAELGLLGLTWIILFTLSLGASRRRHGQLLMFSALAWTPFLLLHYPTHLAIGLLPMTLTLAEILQSDPQIEFKPRRKILPTLLAAAVAAGIFWISRTTFSGIQMNRWHGIADGAMKASEGAPADRRRAMLEAVERQGIVQILENPTQAYWIWRVVGRAQLFNERYPEAEVAFRRAAALFPHEEAEMGLGLALAGQGRISEALHHLEKVCRLNPELAALIQHDELRATVVKRLARQGG